MAKYSYITDKTHNNRKIQVESAKRDGSGKNIENNYAKQNGNYQSLTAGLSNNFDTKLTEKDESAYNFRPTATMGSMELEVGSPCKVKKIVGGSVAFNQLVPNGNFASVSEWTLNSNTTYSVSNNVATIINTSGTYNGIYQYLTAITGHKYLIMGSVKVDETPNDDSVCLFLSINSNYQKTYISGTSWNNIAMIVNAGTGTNTFVKVSLDNWENKYVYAKNIVLFDLTQMFGSTIADYIYSLEQANAGSGVAWFKRYFPKEYYAYNSGELVSVKTQGKKITRFNQFDLNATQITTYGSATINGTKISVTGTYYVAFETKLLPARYYVRFDKISGSVSAVRFQYEDNTLTDSISSSSIVNITKPVKRFYLYCGNGTAATTIYDKVCINFHYDGERDGEYEPYNSETYPCDDVELRGIPQLDENNNLAFDGDEYTNDGNVKRKYGIVDLGTLDWSNYVSSVYGSNGIASLIKKTSSTEIVANWIFCTKYKNESSTNVYNNPSTYDKSISVNTSGLILISDTSLVGYTAEQFKTAMSGVYLIYELETPTDENSIPFTEVQECDNWGTEEWLAPTTDTRPCEVPVGHETDYLPDLKAKLEVAPTTPNENGVYVMEHNASGNSYTPLSTWLSDNGYAKADTLPTKDSVGGTLRQLLAVKETLDFDNTAYVDLGSLTWTYLGNNAFSATNVGVKSVANDSVLKALSTKYKVVSYNTLNGDATKVCMCGYVGDDSRIYVRDTSYADATAFKNAMKGVLLAYEKASQ